MVLTPMFSLARALRGSAALASNKSSRHGIIDILGVFLHDRQAAENRDASWMHSMGRSIHCGHGGGVVNLGAHRGAISVTGENVLGFLQNLVTQDTSSLSETKPSVYCHMLNSKGRFMYDIFLYRLSGDHVVVDVSQQRKNSLIKVLQMYSLRSGVRIQDASDQYHIMVRFGDTVLDDGLVEDARLGNILGYRGISASAPELLKDDVIPVDEYTSLRLSLGVAEGPEEIPEGSVPLEYNLDGLHGISFNKGCYIGQELMARTHYQGQIRKRIMPFETRQGVDISPGDDVIDPKTNKKVGNVRSECVGGFGLALMRIENVLHDGTRTPVDSLKIKSSGASIQPFIPSWWPSSYT